MATFEYSVDGQSITTTKAGRLVSGTIGVNTVKFTFDSSWNGLEKWATFDPNPGKPYKQPLDANGECLIPGEVMGGITLRIGAFGLADGQAYPTVWANKLQMEEGCFIEVPVSDWPEPSPVIEEILEELENKVDKPEDATPGNVAIIGSNGNIADGGHKFSDAFPVGFASGAVATFSDGADGVPIKSMTVQIKPIQAGSGDPSPSNVRAISGRTGATLIRTGKNIGTLKGIGTYNTTTGEEDPVVSSTYAYSEKIKVVSGETLYLSFGFECTQRLVYKWDAGGNYIGFEAQNGAVTSSTYTIPSGVSCIAVVPRQANSTSSLDSFPKFQVVRLNASAYVPYNGTTYAITFPSEAGTVYGGELTVNEDGSGTLMVDKTVSVWNGTESGWNETATAGIYYFYEFLPTASVMCDSYNYIGNMSAPTATTDLSCATRGGYHRLYFRNDSLATLADWKASLASHPITVCYPLATQAVYQLTAPQVRTLLGLNNIWADTGNISIDYHADPTIYVSEKTKAIKQSIAPVEDGYTASQAYAVGSFLFVGDTLYKVTSAIASGATITPGTNAIATTVAEQLMALA